MQRGKSLLHFRQSPRQPLDLGPFQAVHNHGDEQRHAIALGLQVAKLGGKPVKPRPTTFPLGTERGVLDTASTLENLGAGAYLGQLERVQSQEVMALLLSIHTVEGRHAAAIEDALGHPVTPDGPFGAPIRAGDVQNQIQTYLSG